MVSEFRIEIITFPFISFLITCCLLPFIIKKSFSNGFYDNPGINSTLKVHKKPVPYTGGFGVFFGFLITILILSIYYKSLILFNIILGSICILIIGFWDDLKNIKPTYRISFHIIVALFVVLSNKSFIIQDHTLLQIILTIIFIVFSINSVNLFDGLDGLAGGVSSISLLGLSLFFFWQNELLFFLLCLSLFGSVIAFLIFNYNPASIFLGDNGSTFLGFMIAVFVTIASSCMNSLFERLFVFSIIGLPALDTILAIVRRLKQKRSIFHGDRDHIYDLLVNGGWTIRQTTNICYVFQILIVGIVLLIYIIVI